MTLEEEDDLEFEAELAAERERLQALNAVAEPVEVEAAAQPLTIYPFDETCGRCRHARHICPGCGEDLHHGLEVCSECRDRLIQEQAEAEAERQEREAQHRAALALRREERLARAFANAGPEPEAPDMTAVIVEARRDLRRPG